MVPLRDIRAVVIVGAGLLAAGGAAFTERRVVPSPATRAAVGLIVACLAPLALALAMGRIGWTLRALIGVVAVVPGVLAAWILGGTRVELATGSGMLAAGCLSSGALVGATWAAMLLRRSPGSPEEEDKPPLSDPRA